MNAMNVTALRRHGVSLPARLLAASVLAIAAIGAAPGAHAQGHGHGIHGGGGHGAEMMMFGGSPERIGRMVDRTLDGLNATDAQRTQIRQIALAAATDLQAQREAARGLRERGRQLFTAPTVDATAAESVRQQMLAHHDQSSRRVLQAMLDVSRVLTPEQRAAIGQRMQQRQQRMQERMRDRIQREPQPDRPQR